MGKAIRPIAAKRMESLPPYLFARINQTRDTLRKEGVDVIDLGIGDPDLPTPSFIVEAMQRAVEDPSHHHYPSYEGMPALREAATRWYKKRFHVDLDPDREVLVLIGSKEGLAHLTIALVNPGDMTLVPSPGYPVYGVSTLMAGGEPYFMPLLKENMFLPRLNDIPPSVAEKAKIMFLNYPNNPTAATADASFYEGVVQFASRWNTVVCHDAAYSEIAFDGYRPMSFLEADGAKDVGIEIHSLSKTCNMTGWRVGFAVGNRDVIDGLRRVKSNIDSGVFEAIQVAAIAALENYEKNHSHTLGIYQRRRDLLAEGLRKAGLEVQRCAATFYLWITVPRGFTSVDFAALLLSKTGIVLTPGNGFGEWGEGYVRAAFTRDEEQVREAVRRLQQTTF
jgi:LL-diaminopimelate aminotransferase